MTWVMKRRNDGAASAAPGDTGHAPRPGSPAAAQRASGLRRPFAAPDRPGDDHGRSLEDLATVALRCLASGVRAHRTGDLEAAAQSHRRAREVAALLAARAPQRTDAVRLQAEALHQLAEVKLDAGHPEEARAGLDAAEALYSRLGGEALGAVADVRAARARAHAATGRGLSALVDAQSAVLHHVQTLDPDGPEDTQFGLAGALASAAVVQARHGGSRLALTAAQQAGALLVRLDAGHRPEPQGDPDENPDAAHVASAARLAAARRDLVRALQVEIRMQRANGPTHPADQEPLTAALGDLIGPEGVATVLGITDTPRPGLTVAAQHPQVAAETRRAVSGMLALPLDAASIPGFLVAPAHLLDTAREGAATALALASHDPGLALSAGRDAACLYACAEELGLVEHPWPQARIELARWLWLLSELGWLAWTHGEVELAQDLADHAQHPLTRTESGGHLSPSIAQSVNDSAARLRTLRRALR